MGPQEEFRELMARVRAGSAEAMQTLFQRYARHLLRAIRRKLHQPLRSRFDSHDFIQDVWASFYTGDLQRLHFDTPEALGAFLGELARNKVIGAYRGHVQALKRQQTRERSLDDARAIDPSSLPGPQATPSQTVMAEEQWDRLIEQQPPRYRAMLHLLRLGHTHREIADRLNTTTKTVQRLLRRIDPRLAG